MVAPYKITTEENKFKGEFYKFDINETIKERVGEIVIFTADNEEKNGKKSVKIFNKALGGKIIELKGHGHYTLNDMGTEEFPELIEEVIS